MVWDFCYVFLDYDKEFLGYLEWIGLEDRECIV